MIDGQQTLEIVRRINATIQEHAGELTRLDAAIGDGDHGTNLERGFSAVLAKVEAEASGETVPSPGALCKTVAMTLISTVGGAAGPLYGTAFLRASTALGDAGSIDGAAALAAFQAAVEGVKARGKAQTGEKTMLDALVPGLEAFQAAVEQSGQNDDLAAAFAAAAEAARRGMEATIPMLATKGRASYLGERSIGHQDPGATSSYLMLRAVADVLAR